MFYVRFTIRGQSTYKVSNSRNINKNNRMLWRSGKHFSILFKTLTVLVQVFYTLSVTNGIYFPVNGLMGWVVPLCFTACSCAYKTSTFFTDSKNPFVLGVWVVCLFFLCIPVCLLSTALQHSEEFHLNWAKELTIKTGAEPAGCIWQEHLIGCIWIPLLLL